MKTEFVSKRKQALELRDAQRELFEEEMVKVDRGEVSLSLACAALRACAETDPPTTSLS